MQNGPSVTLRVTRSGLQHLLVAGLLALIATGRARIRRAAFAGLVGLWARSYLRYRSFGTRRTAQEREQLRTANWHSFSRHYNERVPTIEEEFDLWGRYHQHRHEMRYDLVAASVRRHLPPGGRVLDLGCGSALVADRIQDLEADYVGLEYGHHHITYPAAKYRGIGGVIALRTTFVRGQAEQLPFEDESFDVVVMSEVIEHLLRPEDAVWEIARVLRTGGVKIMTTNNASELPLRSPLVNPAAWVEKGIGFSHPGLISTRPWTWPEPAPVEAGGPASYLPHTHHIAGETAAMYAAAGLDVIERSTFEFPPPQSATATRLEAWGAPGRRVVDAIEAVATRTPFVRRMGAHLFMVVRKNRPAPASPPPGIWPGPFSD